MLNRPLQERMRTVQRDGYPGQYLHYDDATGTEWVLKKQRNGMWTWENTNGEELGVPFKSKRAATLMLNHYLVERHALTP